MEMRIYKLALLLPLALHMEPASADDSILYSKAELRFARTQVMQEQLCSPALRNILDASPLSEVAIRGGLTPGATPRIPQLGSGGRYMTVEARSMQHLGRHDLVWGNASYTNGRKYDVVWNETSDFLQLYPYVMGDPRGGDMKYEEYRLDGGYSARHGRLYYGVETGYRALSEYRDRDPRPNNTVADLYARLGAGYAVTGMYALAADFMAGKYKQTNELSYFNELGAQKEYQLTGVGNDFGRFSGASNNTFFKGYSLGGVLSLAPTRGYGWTATAEYLFTQMEKVLTDLNRLPLNELSINRIAAGAGYSAERYGFRLRGEYSERRGKDNLFGDPSGNVYPQIGSKRQYEGSLGTICFDAYWMAPSPRGFVWEIHPEAHLTVLSNKHKDSGNQFDSRDATLRINGGMTYISGADMISAKAHIMHRHNISSKTGIYSSCHESLSATMQRIGEYFAKGETSFGIDAAYSRRVWGNKALTIGLGWQHAFYLGNCSDNRYEARIEICI